MIEQIIDLIHQFTEELRYGKRNPNSRLIETALYDDEMALLIMALAEKLQKEINSIHEGSNSPEKKGGQDSSSTILP